MKAVFAHDHRFISAANLLWSESQFNADLWQRYLAHFENLTVVAREGGMPQGKSTADLELSSAPNVSFQLFPDLSSLLGLTVARPKAWRRMRELVDAHDAVIARLPSELGLMAIAAARAQRKPYAVEVVGCAWDALWNYGSIIGRAYAPVGYWRMRRAITGTSHAIYVTERFLQRRYPTQASHVASASNVVLPEIDECALQARMKRIAAMDAKCMRLGLIGSLSGKYKGIQVLISALSKSKDRLPPFHLHVLGAGDQSPWLAEVARVGLAKFISFDGTLPPGPLISNWLDKVDLYLQPSLQEGLPRSLIEAMGRGCPSLASTTGGIPELLPAEDMVPSGDAEALAALIIQRIGDQVWMEASAIRNWKKAQEYRAEILERRRANFLNTFQRSLASGVE